jgi:predicted nucleic acid-binding protein
LRLALDTNVLAYADGLARQPADAAKVLQARRLIDALPAVGVRPVIALQSLAELHSILVRKGGLRPSEAREKVAAWRDLARPIATDETLFDNALDLAAAHAVHIYDAIIMAAAVAADCDLLVSEDLQDGFLWRGLAVTNPFGPRPDPRLAELLR